MVCWRHRLLSPGWLFGEQSQRDIRASSIAELCLHFFCSRCRLPQPFHNKNQNELYKAIRLGKYTFDAEYWKDTSEESNRLIARLLTVDPSTRCTAAEALHSDWIQSVEKSQLSQHELANSLAGISKTRSRLKSVAKTVQWMNKGNRMSSLTAATNVSNLTVDSVSPGIEVPLEGISNLNV